MNTQEGLIALSTSKLPAVEAKQTRISFRIHADLPAFVLPTGVSSQLALEPALAPVPNVKPWLRGVLNLRGNLVPVFDIGMWRGTEALPANAKVLVIAPGADAVGVLCSDSPSLLRVEVGEAVDASDPLATFSTTRFRCDAGYAYEFDARAWLKQVARQVPRHIDVS